MSSVADQLRCAREARGLDVYQVAESTKIKTEHIRALESGNFDAFAAPVYIRGFTRTYATLLKLELPKLMAQLDAELAQSERFSEPPNFSPHKRGVLDFVTMNLSKLNWPIAGAVVLFLMILLGAYWGVNTWRHHKTTDPLSGLSPGLYRPTQTNVGDILGIPTNQPAKK